MTTQQIAQIKTVQCISAAGLHSMAYKEWGEPENPNVLVCVHGLTRVSDDFDALAAEMSGVYRVICPDVVGRGRSGRLLYPQLYGIPQYVSDMVTLLARVLANSEVKTVDWFGTSMGGLIGIVLASLKETPIRKLILNDIGPTLDAVALTRIGEYVGQDVKFDTFDEAAAYIRAISASFGTHTDTQWLKLANDVLRQDADGKWIRHYDLSLAIPFKSMSAESAKKDQALLWAAYDAIRFPTLVVRGAQSDLLSAETAQAMCSRGPKARLLELEGIGHAPTFVHDEQIAAAREFLLG